MGAVVAAVSLKSLLSFRPFDREQLVFDHEPLHRNLRGSFLDKCLFHALLLLLSSNLLQSNRGFHSRHVRFSREIRLREDESPKYN